MKKSSLQSLWPLLLAGFFAGLSSATAQVNEFWDPGGLNGSPGSGGTGTWSTGANWWVSGSSDTTWTNNNIANFAGTNGTVTLGAAETANGLTFSTSNYIISGSSTLTLAGTPTITLPNGSNTMSCALASTVPVTVSGSGILSLTHSGGNTGLTGGVTIGSGATVAMNNISGLGSGTITDSGTLSVTVGATLFTTAITGSGVLNVNIPFNAGSENIRYGGSSLAGFSGTINLIAGLSGGSPGAGQIIMTNTPGSSITWNVGAGATLLPNTIGVPFPANLIILNGPGNSQPFGALRIDATELVANVLLNGTNITIGDDSATQPSGINGVIGDGGNHWGFISVVANGKTLMLQGANTYTGPTVLGGNGESGTLELSAPETTGTSGPLGASAYNNHGSILFNGGTLEYSSVNSNDYSGRFSTNAGQACNINVNGQSVTFATALTSSGGTLTLTDSTGGGILTLSGTNTYGGVTTINSGELNISGSIAGTVINANGGALALDSPTAVPAGTVLTLPASPASGMVNLNFNGTQNITTLNFGSTAMPSGTYGSPGNPNVLYQNSAFTGNGILNVQPPTYWDPGFSEASPGSGGSGSWDSSSTNWFIGSTDAKWVSNNVANFSGNPGTVTLNANETADGLTFNTSGYTIVGTSTLTLGGTPIITLPGDTAEIDCPLAGTGGLTESGPGTLTLGGVNTFTGGTIIDVGGALVLNGANAYAGATTIGSSGTLTIGGSGNLAGGAYPGGILNSGAFIYNSSANQTLSGIMSGPGTLTQNGPGTLMSSGLNTFTGAITINSGTFAVTGAGDLGNNPTFNTGGYGNNINNSGAFIYNSSAQQTLSGQINGTGTLTQSGPGLLTLSGFNGYTGTTMIGGGSELLFSGIGDLGDGDYETTITNNGTLLFNSSFPQILGGAISGSGTLTQEGAATLTLNGTNTYTGATTLSAGTLVLGQSASISNSASISLAAGTTFDVSALSSPYALSTSNSLSASGTAATVATINGPSAGVNFGSQPISLTFAPQTFNGDTSHPALNIAQGALALGGNVIKVRNSGGSALGPGIYTLISVAGGTISGSATLSGNVTGAGLAAHTAASLSVTNGSLNLVVAPPPPAFNSVVVTGGNIVLSGTNGPAGATYVALMTTNVTLPLSSWTPISTNTFSGTGTFSVTNAISGPRGFFAIQVTAP